MRQAENELLMQAGPGIPAGELLRRYRHAVSIAEELTEEKPLKRVTLHGDKVVVFGMPPAYRDVQPRWQWTRA